MDDLQTLLSRKHKADSLPPDTRKDYAEHYKLLVTEIAQYAINNQLPAWDEEVNSEIISMMLQVIAKRYDNPTKLDEINRTFDEFELEINQSFRTKDQRLFESAVRAAREKLRRL